VAAWVIFIGLGSYCFGHPKKRLPFRLPDCTYLPSLPAGDVLNNSSTRKRLVFPTGVRTYQHVQVARISKFGDLMERKPSNFRRLMISFLFSVGDQNDFQLSSYNHMAVIAPTQIHKLPNSILHTGTRRFTPPPNHESTDRHLHVGPRSPLSNVDCKALECALRSGRIGASKIVEARSATCAAISAPMP